MEALTTTKTEEEKREGCDWISWIPALRGDDDGEGELQFLPALSREKKNEKTVSQGTME